MRRYQSYQLEIASELELPELLPSQAPEATPDVTINLGPVPADGLADGEQRGPYLWVSATALWLNVPDVARYLIEDGERITIQPMPGVDEDSIRVFLLGSALGALLFQRGWLVLHGNAIRVGDQCLVCVGRSGAGKSTLAATLHQRGHQVLADDVVPVDGQGRALPGFPRIKLWQDVADQLAIETTPLRRIRPDMEKFNLPVNGAYCTEPLPVRWIYILSTRQVPEFHIEPLRGLERFRPLYGHTYRMRFLKGMQMQPEHLQKCGQLAARIHLARVTRPRRGFDVDQLIDALLADMAKHP